MNNQVITKVKSHKHLGVTFECSGTWHNHIQLITSKAWQRIHIMRKLKFRLDRKALETIYMAFIRPILEYADVVWCNITKYEEDELEKIQCEASRIVTGTTKLVSKLFQIIIISLAAETNRYFMLELGQIVAVCITPYSVKTSYKTSSVHVAKLKTPSISSSLV